MNTKPPKPKTCKARDPETGLRCNVRFVPRAPWQEACSPECADRKVKADNAKQAAKQVRKQRQERREGLERLKTRGDHAKAAQIAYNRWRRLSQIAEGRGCISCGTHNGKMNCGHFRSVGSAPELRFEPLNTWLQCERCNTSLSGNLIEYRKALVILGVDLDWLEGKHEPKHYTIDDLKAIKTEYSRRARELEKT